MQGHQQKKKKIPNSLGYYFLHSNFILEITDNNDSTVIKVVTTITRHTFLKQTLLRLVVP